MHKVYWGRGEQRSERPCWSGDLREEEEKQERGGKEGSKRQKRDRRGKMGELHLAGTFKGCTCRAAGGGEAPGDR